MYNWFTLLYSRNWHNVVNQLYSNKIKKKKKNFDLKSNKYHAKICGVQLKKMLHGKKLLDFCAKDYLHLLTSRILVK